MRGTQAKRQLQRGQSAPAVLHVKRALLRGVIAAQRVDGIVRGKIYQDVRARQPSAKFQPVGTVHLPFVVEPERGIAHFIFF